MLGQTPTVATHAARQRFGLGWRGEGRVDAAPPLDDGPASSEEEWDEDWSSQWTWPMACNRSYRCRHSVLSATLS